MALKRTHNNPFLAHGYLHGIACLQARWEEKGKFAGFRSGNASQVCQANGCWFMERTENTLAVTGSRRWSS